MNTGSSFKEKVYHIKNKLKAWWIMLNNRNSCLVDGKFIAALLILYFLNSSTVDFIALAIPGFSWIIRSLTVIWLGLVIYDSREFFWELVRTFWPLIGCVVLLGIGFLTYDRAIVQQDIMQLIYFVTIVGIFFYYIRERKKDNNNRLIILLLVWALDVLLSSLHTIIRLIENPYVSRLLTAGKDVPNPEAIISYSIVYGLVLLAPFLCAQIFRTEQYQRLAWSVIAAFVFVFILLTQFTTAVLLYVLGMMLVVVSKLLRTKNGFWWVAGIIALGMILLYSLKGIVKLYIFPASINSRLNMIYDFFVAGKVDDETDLVLRLEVYAQSLKAIVFNGFLGDFLLHNAPTGQHSEILDAIGGYGIVYFAILVYFFVKMYDFYKGNISKENFRIYQMTLIIFIIMSLINTTLWSEMMIILMGILPILLIVVNNNSNSIKEALKKYTAKGRVAR